MYLSSNEPIGIYNNLFVTIYLFTLVNLLQLITLSYQSRQQKELTRSSKVMQRRGEFSDWVSHQLL